ncbi:MAG: Ig-like domain-containing protein [Pseudomonadota bacterium]|nr:Ig-like domain-containing protein [Pseudomonadota bacterium]
MKFLFRASLLASTAAILAACGGGSDGRPSLTPGGGSSGTGGSGQTTGTTEYRFGALSGESFSAGEISTERQALEAGQSTDLKVYIVDQNNNLVTDAATVIFNSICIGNGQSELNNSIVENSSGVVASTYTARGCDGEDIVTANTSIDGVSYRASVKLTTQPAPLGALGFVSAEPQQIGIKDSGILESQSRVSFKLTNASGGPVANQQVSFELNTSVGGISLDSDTNTTNSEGVVTVTVTSGTVATPVRVTAIADDGTKLIRAQSSALSITTGLPDQNSFSISASELNIEGAEYDGTETEITIRAADRFNNPAPDGTAINFTTEGGSIDPSCSTTGGLCTVKLSSQSPRPIDGRVTVLATAIGEESFKDTSPSNGRFDDAELPSLDDRSEPFLDTNENSTFDEGNEYYVDVDNSGSYTTANGKFDGLLCNGPSLCSASPARVMLSADIVILFSESNLNVNTNSSSYTLTGSSQDVVVSVVGNNGQPPAAGTIISASSDVGTILEPSSYTMLSTTKSGPAEFTFRIKGSEPDEDKLGTLTILVTTPKGNISREYADLIDKKAASSSP